MAELFEDFINFLISVKDGFLYFIPGIGRPDRVLEYLFGHLLVTFVALFCAIFIGVLLGILITRVRKLRTPVITVAGIIYTIPALALFGVLISFVGIGFTPAVIALTLYSLLVIIRNTAVGIDEVDEAINEAARGMGMTDFQILVRIELPLALPVILAGIRVATVAAISMATIASYFGASSLGTLIFEGMATGGTRNDKIVAGAIAASALAIFFDRLLGWGERRMKLRTR
jgi:osmoprotectant transport system permease protein